MPYLTAPDAQKTEQRTFRYFVELASDTLDHEGVPERFQIVDVVVLENTKEAIKAAITAANWLEGYSMMVAHWIPEDNCPF